jgi:hypothetical protein
MYSSPIRECTVCNSSSWLSEMSNETFDASGQLASPLLSIKILLMSLFITYFILIFIRKIPNRRSSMIYQLILSLKKYFDCKAIKTFQDDFLPSVSNNAVAGCSQKMSDFQRVGDAPKNHRSYRTVYKHCLPLSSRGHTK